jgi:hypothetical protein
LTERKLLAAFALCLLAVARAPAARADEERAVAPEVVPAGAADGAAAAPAAEAAVPAPAPPRAPKEPSVLSTYYPPPVDGPELRLPESPTRLYVDGAYATAGDLSALQLIEGSAKNVRLAVGGTLRWHRFAFDGEVPFVQVTTVDVTAVSGGQPPIPQDAHQTGISFGDVRLGAIWTEHLLGDALVGGFGLRIRLPTHTTNFTFHVQPAGNPPPPLLPLEYGFPYYAHIEPAAILGGALGRFIFVVNEGLEVLWGPNGQIEGQEVVVPTIMFWDSHVAVAYAPVDVVGASVELGTDVQVNDTNDPQFPISNIRSAWVAPALQLHFGDYRVDLIARLGLPKVAHGTDAYGVLEFVGTNSYTLRVGRTFN